MHFPHNQYEENFQLSNHSSITILTVSVAMIAVSIALLHVIL